MTTDLVPSGERAPVGGGRLPDLSKHLAVERALQHLGRITWSPVMNPYYRSDIRGDRRRREMIQRDLAGLPDDRTLRNLAHEVDMVLSAEPNRKITATAVALLFDSRARQPANPPTYLSALCSDLFEMGYQPGVITAACQRLRRTTTFVPEICEVIEACRKVQEEYAALGRMSVFAIEKRAEILAAIEAATSDPDPANRSPQRARMYPNAKPGDPEW